MKILFYFIFLMAASLAAAERPMNELPMYGGQHDPQVARSEAASQQAAQLGWKYYHKGDLDTAIKRFNQAWMFDRKNAEAYWGFGVIMGQRSREGNIQANLQESIRFLVMARDLDPKNGRIIGDLAFSHAVQGSFLTSERKDGRKEFSEAEALFKQAYALDPKYPPIPANWSVLKFYVGDYSAAKQWLDVAKGLGFKPDPAYVKDLSERLK